MFKWGSKRDTKSSSKFEPKTPKLTSVSLPDGRYTPIDYHDHSTEKPISNLLFRHFSPDRRGVSVLGTRRTPVDTSRPRTMSSGRVEAPRPIRPHPSQGASIPILEHRDRAVIDPTRKPISVPSAQYLEAQIRKLPSNPAVAHKHQLLNAEVDYPEEKRVKEIARRNGGSAQRKMLKGYPDDIEDAKPQKSLVAPAVTKESSKRSKKVPVDFANWKGVPVTTAPMMPPETDSKGPLKSALKKPTVKTTAAPIKSAMKKESSYDPVKAYYSEDESSRRKNDRSKYRSAITPSKAWLEAQQEKRQERARRSSTSRTQPPVVVDNSAVYGPAAFPSSNSTTPSPVETGHEYYRRRRASHSSEPIANFNSNNYLPAYIRERVEQQAQLDEKDFWERVEKFGKGMPTHPQLEWPLVDYSIRMWRTPPTPKIYFDAGFNPRIPKYAPRVKRGLYTTPMTRQEETMEIGLDATVYKISLVNRTLHNWPIDMHFNYQIRVIDVFRVIYDTFSQPLTRVEYENLGEDVIKECFPAFKQRCMDGPDFMHNEERKGFLRIDLLGGRRIFKGLVAIPNKPNTFEILFDDGH